MTGAVLGLLGGNSPYLSALAVREAPFLLGIEREGPDAMCDRTLSTLARLRPGQARAEIAAGLRQAKRQVALATALADIGGIWTLEQVTGALSDLAEAALRVAVEHLLLAAHEKRELRLPHPAAPSRGAGFVVLGMGKLGARELNYSSDIDLVLLYDPAAHPYNTDRLGAIFARITHALVALMQTADADGYVFRTDLRLRPDPAATPPAISLPGALAYYESQAQTWERAAMIKARPVAGDVALGQQFLAAIRPFIWRRHLDFAAIADIQAMKRRIDGHKGTALREAGSPVSRLLGHDVKLGQGGIREIEFCAQALQLVWGGRDPGLRSRGTLAALAAEAHGGFLPAVSADRLVAAYKFLRRTEHRLQMVADRQTHSLPETAAGLAGFAGFMGYASAEAFADAALAELEAVNGIFAGLFEAPPATDQQEDEARPVPDAARLRRLGFARPEAVLAAIAAWQAGHPRALRAPRARHLLDSMLPAILAALASQADPDAVFARFDAWLNRLPSGVQPLSLIRHNPALLDRLALVLGAAPSLADHLSAVPAALEGLLSPRDIDPEPEATLAAALHDAAGLDEALGIASRLVRGEEFRLAVAELDARIDADAAGRARTALADAAIRAVLPRVLAEHTRRFGRVRGGALVVVAVGKAGSFEMMAGSDLDLMVLYDHAADAPESDGARKLAASQYFARAAQALIAALTVPTRDGPLYTVDMRLRPSGGKGPVAVSLAAFTQYHRPRDEHGEAWTWERLALTRARVVAGPAALCRRVERAITDAIGHAGPEVVVRHDVAAMRARLARELPASSPYDVKLRPGGLIEVEFIAQALLLIHAGRRGLASPVTATALENLARAGLLPDGDAATLIEADRVWRGIQGLLRIMLGRSLPKTLPAPAAARLAGLLGTEDVAGRMAGLAATVRAAFIRHVGEIREV